MKESRIEQMACKQILEKFNVISVKLTPAQSTGYPDRLFWLPGGKPLLIEFKRPNEQLSPKQSHINLGLKMLGYQVEVCRSAAQAVAVVELALLSQKRAHLRS